MGSDVILIGFEWSEVSGHFKTAGSPNLFGWVQAIFIQSIGIADGRVSIIARLGASHTWAEFSQPVGQAEATALAQALVELGLPERAPQIDAVADTSDMWFALRVSVTVGEHVQTFAIHTESSGFSGPDAERLRAVFRRIFGMAGYVDYDPVLYG